MLKDDGGVEATKLKEGDGYKGGLREKITCKYG